MTKEQFDLFRRMTEDYKSVLSDIRVYVDWYRQEEDLESVIYEVEELLDSVEESTFV